MTGLCSLGEGEGIAVFMLIIVWQWIYLPVSSNPVLFFLTLVHERLLRTSEDFVWPIDSTFNGKFIIDVEFLDLKISPVNVRTARSNFSLPSLQVSFLKDATCSMLFDQTLFR